jgi:hypothetical protein
MPGQQIEVVTGLQSLHEHERIAMALNDAIRADTGAAVHPSYTLNTPLIHPNTAFIEVLYSLYKGFIQPL